MSTITLPFDAGSQTYDRDKLTTAYLVLLDVLDTREKASLSDAHAVAARLRHDHGFTTDAITYAVGARICSERGIEP